MIRTIIAAADLDVAAVASAHVNEVQPVTDDVGAIVGGRHSAVPKAMAATRPSALWQPIKVLFG